MVEVEAREGMEAVLALKLNQKSHQITPLTLQRIKPLTGQEVRERKEMHSHVIVSCMSGVPLLCKFVYIMSNYLLFIQKHINGQCCYYSGDYVFVRG